MNRASGRALTLGLTIAALSSISIASPAKAQGANPWTLGIVDQSFVWAAPPNAASSISKCAWNITKQNGLSNANDQSNGKSPLQTCLLEKMHEGGASKNAIAFSKWFFAAHQGDAAYITALAKPQYGPVQMASVFYPGRANNNDGYIFVNGTDPQVTDPSVVFAPGNEVWKHDASYKAIKSAHPSAMVYPALTFVSLTKRDAGGQRFTMSAPILDGCHACKRLGTVDIAFDFGNLGAPKGASTIAVRPAP